MYSTHARTAPRRAALNPGRTGCWLPRPACLPPRWKLSLGQHADAGRKPVQQDCHGARIPAQPLPLTSKGAVLALADGIGSSSVSQDASRRCGARRAGGLLRHLRGLERQALHAARAGSHHPWLHAQTQRSPYRHDPRSRLRLRHCRAGAQGPRGALLLPCRRCAHRAAARRRAGAIDRGPPRHIGGTKAIRAGRWVRAGWTWTTAAWPWIRATSTCWPATACTSTCCLPTCAPRWTPTLMTWTPAPARWCRRYFEHGSPDNLSLQLVRAEALPTADLIEAQQAPTCPSQACCPRSELDGFRIERELAAATAAIATTWATEVPPSRLTVLKTPLGGPRPGRRRAGPPDAGGVDRRRIPQPHALRPLTPCARAPGSTARPNTPRPDPWRSGMRDHPCPSWRRCATSSNRSRAACRPSTGWRCCTKTCGLENLMIDRSGTVRIIDFLAACRWPA